MLKVYAPSPSVAGVCKEPRFQPLSYEFVWPERVPLDVLAIRNRDTVAWTDVAVRIWVTAREGFIQIGFEPGILIKE